MKTAALLIAIPLIAQETANLYSIERERALGEQLAAEIRRKLPHLETPAPQAYVRRIGSQLVSHVQRPRFPYSFEVVAGDEASEPMAIPGGFVFVPDRAFVACLDEAEFAALLAHSIAHLELRHGVRAAASSYKMNVVSIPMIFMGGWGSGHSDTQRSRLAVPVGFLEFQREYELEADKFGLELAARAGFPPAAFRRYIARTQPADAKFSPLPARELRLSKIDAVLAALPDPVMTSSDEFLQIQAAIPKTRQPKPRRPPTLRR